MKMKSRRFTVGGLILMALFATPQAWREVDGLLASTRTLAETAWWGALLPDSPREMQETSWPVCNKARTEMASSRTPESPKTVNSQPRRGKAKNQAPAEINSETPELKGQGLLADNHAAKNQESAESFEAIPPQKLNASDLVATLITKDSAEAESLPAVIKSREKAEKVKATAASERRRALTEFSGPGDINPKAVSFIPAGELQKLAGLGLGSLNVSEVVEKAREIHRRVKRANDANRPAPPKFRVFITNKVTEQVAPPSQPSE
jgi:hypothetical protein